MEIANIERDLRRATESTTARQPLQEVSYVETRYRWVVVGLGACMMFLNGLLNNIVIPLESKMVSLYGVDSRLVNLANILVFLSFLLANLPANHILDSRGIKFGFALGNLLYLIGITLCCFVNVGFPFVIVGCVFFALGQPFVTNVPAKIAAYWFFP